VNSDSFVQTSFDAQEAAAIMSDDEEDKALQDFKTESKDPS
jgi:hypothetical protein